MSSSGDHPPSELSVEPRSTRTIDVGDDYAEQIRGNRQPGASLRSTTSSSSQSTASSATSSRAELDEAEGHVFGWVPEPRMFEDQRINACGIKEGPWSFEEEYDLERAHRRYGKNWTKVIRSHRYRKYAFAGRSYSSIVCKCDRMRLQLKMSESRERHRAHRSKTSSRICI
ncbi:hypothetical protein Pmar_PMAR020851 [Perkinsus marinus ATCC 50983]|uniref:Myb-like domain-containing protein n=1 Tax=Perkinsus marinus (strain ATCC 50983 / TXsc) TaxID=423536 RepID=C5KN36_PERM5|nr:hypothetical protein Pmar_PMAR020851 [Perkinsus marinus ATCC 50983]EER14070.1 hypothetical protein Pmar_PMAR020851 [Perkinsus marinus ATCC 50983]|eukprot:XP_002782275.1 hypothetical protein Pmar_PMAR020851 [Perkinsus marinus ATCC 50983]